MTRKPEASVTVCPIAKNPILLKRIPVKAEETEMKTPTNNPRVNCFLNVGCF